jgi:dolichol-phosphate mannosyltransferase
LKRQVGLAEQLGRLEVTAALVPLCDVVLFIAVTSGGVRLGPAHILSFAGSSLLNYILRLRGAVSATGRAHDPRLYCHLLVVWLFALSLRGGVLGLLTNVWGWPAQIAILFAVAATTAVTLPGYSFALRSFIWTLGSGAYWRVVALSLVIGAFLIRLVYLGQLELIPEESYYWNYAQHLDIGYLDHPPMVAWLIWLGTAAFGDAEFGLRFGALGCAAVAAFFMYRLTRNLFGEPSALVALVLMQILPFFFLAGVLMTPDAPLTAAWAASLYFLERALIAGRPSAWLLAGVCLGVGLVSKYTIGLLVPAMILFVLLDRRSRRWLLRWEPYAGLFIALAIFSPVITWNARHDWASFAFQTSRRLAERPKFALHTLILSVLVLLTPTGLLTLLRSPFMGRAQEVTLAAEEPGRRWLFLRVAVFVPLAVFVAFSLRHDVKVDWTGTLWLAAIPGLAAAIVSFGQEGSGGIRARIHSAWGPTAIVCLLIFAVLLHYLTLGLPGAGYGKHTELAPVGWRDLGQQIGVVAEDLRARSGSEPLIVGMDRYELASQLTFYSPDPARAVKETSSRFLFGNAGLMYDRWFPPALQEGRNLVLVGWSPDEMSDAFVARHAQRLEPITEGTLSRDGTLIRHYYYRIAYDYHVVGE